MSENVGKKYTLVKKLGSGSFGEVHLARDRSSGEEVAIKFEKTSTKYPQLKYESRVYLILQGGPGIPSLIYFGREANYNVMVTQRLGKSLEDHFVENKSKLQNYTTFLCGYQMIERVEYMHSRYFLHRDIKPDNFMSGFSDPHRIYVIDFGLSKRYRHPKTKKHIPYIEGKSLTGTPRYASINNHLGVEASRRDDIESIGYVLVYLANGSLPWQGLQAKNMKAKYQKIMEHKMSSPLPVLCKSIDPCFAKYLEYSRSLRFEDKPNYSHLKGLFHEALCTLCEMFQIDWQDVKPEWVKPIEVVQQETLLARQKMKREQQQKSVYARSQVSHNSHSQYQSQSQFNATELANYNTFSNYSQQGFPGQTMRTYQKSRNGAKGSSRAPYSPYGNYPGKERDTLDDMEREDYDYA